MLVLIATRRMRINAAKSNVHRSLCFMDHPLCGCPVSTDFYQSFFDINSHFTLANYQDYLTSPTYLKMTLNSVWYAALITVVTLVISYPTAYVLTQLQNRQFWLLIVILPTWINLLLKTYAFIGLFANRVY